MGQKGKFSPPQSADDESGRGTDHDGGAGTWSAVIPTLSDTEMTPMGAHVERQTLMARPYSGEGGEERTCRICLDTDGRDFIAPCQCAGTQKWVHRGCLDTWRATRTAAFDQCTECHFKYRITVKNENMGAAERTYKWLVARDSALFVAGLLSLMVAFAVGVWACDEGLWGSWIRGHWVPAALAWSPALAYAFAGLVGFLAVAGFTAVVVALLGACCSPGQAQSAPCCDGPIICFYDDFLFPRHHTCMCCCGDCGDCTTPQGGVGNCCAAGHGSNDCDGDAAKILLVVAAVLILLFAVLGVFVLGYLSWTVLNKIARRHYHVLKKKGLAKDVYIVQDLNGYSREEIMTMSAVPVPTAPASAPPVPEMWV